MKRWLWGLAALALMISLGGMPFPGSDIATLRPVEVLRVQGNEKQILVETDTGDCGIGETLESAFADLKSNTPGKIFLETADYLLLNAQAMALLPQLGDYLRPACSLCVENGSVELESVAAFLAVHEPELTLQEYLAGERSLQQLITQEGRMYLVS